VVFLWCIRGREYINSHIYYDISLELDMLEVPLQYRHISLIKDGFIMRFSANKGKEPGFSKYLRE